MNKKRFTPINSATATGLENRALMAFVRKARGSTTSVGTTAVGGVAGNVALSR